MRFGIVTATLLLAACGDNRSGADVNAAAADPASSAASPARQHDGGEQQRAHWALQSTGSVLALNGADGTQQMRLICGAGTLTVNVPAFQPIASEERLSFGSGGEVVALVADTRGDMKRGGVSGSGPVPSNLTKLIAGPISAVYGAQSSGPHSVLPPELGQAFVNACAKRETPDPSPTRPATGACMTQGEEQLPAAERRVVGTEPFWGARIVGRCVTYSTPEDQTGTRIWTRYAKSGSGESWTGALGGKAFVLKLRRETDCSDGMSDRLYPFAAELQVGGDTRKGCAAPA